VTFFVAQLPGFANCPSGDTLDAALDPPPVEHAQARNAVKRSLHSTCSGCFQGRLRRVKPDIHARRKHLRQKHVVVFKVGHLGHFVECLRNLENMPDDLFAALVSRMGFAGIDRLDFSAPRRYPF